MTYGRLCILMRTDMDSMNPGKGMAQAAHAANLFSSLHAVNYAAWATEDNAFGTTIVLDAGDLPNLEKVLGEASKMGYSVGIVTDRTYPVRDGSVTHFVPVVTCGYVYVVEGEDPPPLVQMLDLHP